MIEVTREEEIAYPRDVRPHVVLLGAGASRAAAPDGDANGRRLPVMADFVETLRLGSLLDKAGVEWEGRNFEELYSAIAGDHDRSQIRAELERGIEDYFSELILPSSPTVYDYLVLGLRSKDVIATFNWDPFLIQAYRRSLSVTRSLPHLLFLHGCVLHGYCETDRVSGLRGARCSVCGERLRPDRLLFPIGQKNYSTEPSIASAWDALKQRLKESLMFTIFGYGAPASDKDAVDLLKDAWGSPQARQFEQVEIVDLRSEDELAATWSPFIHTHHYDVFEDFHDSFIAKHPRRSIEAFEAQYLEAMLIDENPAPLQVTLDQLHTWYGALVSAER